jgi:hypothetical protein
MHELIFDEFFSQRVATVRNAVTLETNLIRQDRQRFRICDPKSSNFEVALSAHGERGKRVEMLFNTGNLYVTQIQGNPFGGQYNKLLNKMNFDTLIRAFASVEKGSKLSGKESFLHQTVLIFAVAESLRSDKVSSTVEDLIRAGLRGTANATLDRMPEMWPFKDEWGDGSDAVIDVAGSNLQVIGKTGGLLGADGKPLVASTSKWAGQSAHTEYTPLEISGTKIPEPMQEIVEGIKTLKNPSFKEE